MADHPLDVLERELEAAARRQAEAAARAARVRRAAPTTRLFARRRAPAAQLLAGRRPPAARAAPTARLLAHRRSATVHGSRRALAVLIAFGAFAVAGVGWAATSLLPTGPPVSYVYGAPAVGSGLGTPVAGTVRMLTTTVRDPAGGLRWGLRSFATSRGYTCLQVGRVLDGKLGLIGHDGAFANDGRFHELRPGVVTDTSRCVANDGAGHGFLSLHLGALAVSASATGCAVLPNFPGRRCRRADLRTVDFGLLGAHAKRVSYGRRTLRPLGPDGGYLIVQRHRSDAFSATLGPAASTLTHVDYAGAHCRLPCAVPPGFTPIPQRPPGDVATRVSAVVRETNAIRVRFRARVAVTDNTSAYNVMVYPPSACAPSGALSAAVEHNVAAGAAVFKDIRLVCAKPGSYRVIVSYRTRSPIPRPGASGLRYPGTIVGRTTVRLR